VSFGKEWEHLKQHTEKDKENLNEKVSELKQQGRSLREIGAELGISHMKAKRILNECNTL
jgi:DNA-directed RNA polymerase specialized sigma subunit